MTEQEQAEEDKNVVNKKAFGEDFKWGVSTAAYQIEGGHDADGKGPSIWDDFTNTKKKVLQGLHANHTCDFYNRYTGDMDLMRSMHVPNFRFSLSWPRILPEGTGPVNQKGLDYYDRLIDNCLSRGIEPWVTLYHWDLPAVLERKGGWVNRDVIQWFSEYVQLCAAKFGDRVRHWMVLNEPMAFVGAGYFLGIHAPGRRNINAFLAATHHATLCQAEGGRLLKQILPQAEVGTTFSCSHIEPYRELERDQKAARRVDALLNRIFLEPALGLGYPLKDIPYLNRIEKFFEPGDEDRQAFDFDFIGLQNYTREMVKFSFFTPFLQAKLVPAARRGVPHTVMGWEVYPESIYHMLHRFHAYGRIKKIIITENGSAFPDVVKDGQVNDTFRLDYLQRYLGQVLRARQEGVKVEGYFVWSFSDNFEWAEGYHPRFGLVYVDFETQERIIKSSGHWYSQFLAQS